MWFMTPFGFFSVVHKPGESGLTIRSRTRGDLLRLRRHYLPELSDPVTHVGTDYPWRARCNQEALAQAMSKIVRQIDYANFKDEVALINGKARSQRYAKVWHALYGMDEDLPEPTRDGYEGLPWSEKVPVGKKRAFGGVVIDTQGRVLLREVANHFDGYVWTYAKGRPDPGESPRQAALSEVKEEMGVEARILLPLPGTFAGTTTQTQFFLMVVDARKVDLAHRCKETSGLVWVLPAEAERLIAQTTNTTGRERDLKVLTEALAYLPSPAPYQRPIARMEDWEFRPMPAQRTQIEFQRKFSPQEMAQVVRGFISQVMEQKWCAYFEDGVLRLHRSWTGFEIYRLHLMPCKSEKGHWEVVKVELNRHPGQCTFDEQEALEGLGFWIRDYLLNYGEEPALDGFALALMEASKPNYLGSPRVLQELFKPFLDAAFDHFFLEELSSGVLERCTRNIISAMTDDPMYTRMPWHSREQLGVALIAAFNLTMDSATSDSFSTLIERALARVLESIAKMAAASSHSQESIEQWSDHMEVLGHFVVQVFLGTHQLSHPDMSLSNLVDQPPKGNS